MGRFSVRQKIFCATISLFVTSEALSDLYFSNGDTCGSSCLYSQFESLQLDQWLGQEEYLLDQNQWSNYGQQSYWNQGGPQIIVNGKWKTLKLEIEIPDEPEETASSDTMNYPDLLGPIPATTSAVSDPPSASTKPERLPSSTQNSIMNSSGTIRPGMPIPDPAITSSKQKQLQESIMNSSGIIRPGMPIPDPAIASSKQKQLQESIMNSSGIIRPDMPGPNSPGSNIMNSPGVLGPDPAIASDKQKQLKESIMNSQGIIRPGSLRRESNIMNSPGVLGPDPAIASSKQKQLKESIMNSQGVIRPGSPRRESNIMNSPGVLGPDPAIASSKQKQPKESIMNSPGVLGRGTSSTYIMKSPGVLGPDPRLSKPDPTLTPTKLGPLVGGKVPGSWVQGSRPTKPEEKTSTTVTSTFGDGKIPGVWAPETNETTNQTLIPTEKTTTTVTSTFGDGRIPGSWVPNSKKSDTRIKIFTGDLPRPSSHTNQSFSVPGVQPIEQEPDLEGVVTLTGDALELLEDFGGIRVCPKIDTSSEVPAQSFPSRWNKGCEVLAKSPLDESDIDQLYGTCLASLKEKILDGLITGNLTESKFADHQQQIYRNMLDREKLNPEEQRFISMVFTAFGETRGYIGGISVQDNVSKQKIRYQNVMKVIDNRSNYCGVDKRDDFTEMNICLLKFQFECYQPGNPNAVKMLNYEKSQRRSDSMKNAVAAYVEYDQKRKLDPDYPIRRNIYHFVAKSYCEYVKGKNKKTWFTDERNGPIEGIDDDHHLFFAGRDLHPVNHNMTWAYPNP